MMQAIHRRSPIIPSISMLSASLFFVPDMLAALREWGRVLVPGGYVGFCGFGPTFLQPLRDLWTARLQQYGVTPAAFPWQRLADLATCQHLLHEAGFGQIAVQQEQLGYYLQTAEEWWEESWASLRRLAVLQLTPEQQAQFKAAHPAEVAALVTAQGLWIDVAANFACGRKQAGR
jgi:ubiquinone/menaquinone biosynthesis C-methylase UbiE